MKTLRPLILLPILLLAACQSHRVTTHVLTDAQPDWDYAETYALAPFDEDMETHPRFRTYADYVERALEPHELRRIHSPLEADIVIFLHWDRFRGRPEPIYVPYRYGATGMTAGANALVEGMAVARARREANTLQYLLLLRAYDVAAQFETSRPLIAWETSIMAPAMDSDTHEMLPILLAAARDDLGRTTGGIQERRIFRRSATVSYIRTGERPE